MNTLSTRYHDILRHARLSPAAAKSVRGRLAVVVEVLLVVLLAWLASRLFLAAVSPVADVNAGASPATSIESVPSSVTSYDVLTRYDPFTASAVEQQEQESGYIEAVETTLDISVSGMLVLENGRGSAIIKTAGGAAKTYLTGDEIENGVTLERLEPGRAIISRNGILESVTVQESAPRMLNRTMAVRPNAASPGPAAANPAGISMDRLAEIFTLRPVRDAEGGMTGIYVVTPGPDAAAFASTGLADGDIIKKVNGVIAPENPERLFEFINMLKSAENIVIVVDRGGTETEVSLNLSELGDA